MAKKCKGVTKSGKPCKRNAGESGFCSLHDPSKAKQQATKKKNLKEANERLYDLVNMVIEKSRATGWDITLRSIDEDNWRYASLIVKRNIGFQEVSALVQISCNSKVRILTEKTSFYAYGLDGLRHSFTDGMDAISWLKPIEEKTKEKDTQRDLLDALYHMLRHFDLLVRQLESRYAGREPLYITDEYDVQYILHALLCALFSDVRPEEVCPSYAGASSRLDFLLKDEKVVIETKMASASLKDKQIGEQLIIDIERYQAHPDCKTLVCLVYNPEHHLRNPVGIENDLRRKTDTLKVVVFVVPH